MSSPRARSRSGSETLKCNSVKDFERLACMVMEEARTSFPKAARVLAKTMALATVGFVLASNCCLSQYLTPVGIIVLTIAAAWFEGIREECKGNRFFPSQSLNSFGASMYGWRTVVAWTVTLFILTKMATVVHTLSFLELAFPDPLWNVFTMAVVPLGLMLIGRAVQPYRFARARDDLQKAEGLVRQVVTARKSVDAGAVAQLFETDRIPLYKLGSVSKLLYTFVAGCDSTEKLKVELDLPNDNTHSGYLERLLSIVYSPFRMVASELFLSESSDIVFYIIAAIYFTLAHLSFDRVPLPLTPLLLAPLFGPKSRGAQYVRALQEDIRLAQGASVASKVAKTTTQEPEYDFSLNWAMLIYIVANHIAAFYCLLVLVVFGGTCPLFGHGAVIKRETYCSAFVLYVCSGLGITAGVHRLWSHRSYKAGFPLRCLLLIFNSMANQGCIFHWARDHRVHHLHSDTHADPHDARRGLFFSHVGWLFVKKSAAVKEAGAKLNINDLYSDKLVMFQKKADPFWNLLWCFGLPSLLVLAWGDTLWNGFLLAELRYVAVLNATWAVNSVVHAIGTKPYNPAHATTENGWVSLFSMGEGWHNWHHAFDWDYAAAEMGALSQFNPTKVFIDVMAFLGLAWDRKKADKMWALRKARWQGAQGRPIVESIEGPIFFKRRVVTFGPMSYEEEVDVVSKAE